MKRTVTRSKSVLAVCMLVPAVLFIGILAARQGNKPAPFQYSQQDLSEQRSIEAAVRQCVTPEQIKATLLANGFKDKDIYEFSYTGHRELGATKWPDEIIRNDGSPTESYSDRSRRAIVVNVNFANEKITEMNVSIGIGICGTTE